MKKNRINLQFHYKPIYNYFFFRKTRCEVSYKVNSNEYLKNAVSLPIYYNLDQKSLKKVIAIIKKFINKYKK